MNSFELLITTVPPEWVTKPQDEEVVEGQDITFPCKVTGVPQPTVVWRKLAGKFLFDDLKCNSDWENLYMNPAILHVNHTDHEIMLKA